MLVAVGLLGLAGCGSSGSETGVPKNALPPEKAGEAAKVEGKSTDQDAKIKPLK